jgi:hypothetical protein
MQSIGGKCKGASSSDLIRIKKYRAQANAYDQNNIKSKGVVSGVDIRQFRPDLNTYAALVNTFISPRIHLVPDTPSAVTLGPTSTIYYAISGLRPGIPYGIKMVFSNIDHPSYAITATLSPDTHLNVYVAQGYTIISIFLSQLHKIHTVIIFSKQKMGCPEIEKRRPPSLSIISSVID